MRSDFALEIQLEQTSVPLRAVGLASAQRSARTWTMRSDFALGIQLEQTSVPPRAVR